MKRSSSLQWSFLNNNASSSQYLSFKSVQDQGGSHKQYPLALSQRNLGLDNQRGSQYPGHQWQPTDVLSANLASEIRSFPITNQANQVFSANISSTMAAARPNGPVVGSTDLKSSSIISTGPCQLTLFYNGAVCVYDNVSPEKAQAIMLLAGDSESKNSTGSSTAAVPSPLNVQPTVLNPQAIDSAVPNQFAGLSSSISLVTPLSKVSAVASSCAIGVDPIKSVAAPARIKCSEPPISDVVTAAGNDKLTPAAVPQARKASLARFLEKRKERVTAASPYVASKSGSQCNTIEPGGSTFPGNLSSSSTPLSVPASN